MKKLALFLMFAFNPCLAQIRNGDRIANIRLDQLLNAPEGKTSLDALKGKVMILEFWATWCGPCLEAMPHLKELQRKYDGKLQVIAVTDESPERIRRFLSSKPSNLWFAIDSGRTVANQFPHHMIPHTVVISSEGRLIAQTTPGAVSDQQIDRLIQGKEVQLPEKRDNPMRPAEAIATYFGAADTIRKRFVMQGEIIGSPGMHTTHLNDSTFKRRRITCFNLPLTTLYGVAYGHFPYKRTINQIVQTGETPVYSLDLIVEEPEALLPALQRELSSRFDLQARIEAQQVEVYALKVADRTRFGLIPRNRSGVRTYSARQGEMNQDAVTMADLAGFLEDFGPGFVVDETGNSEKLDVHFAYEPENPHSLTEVLATMGLTLVKAKRAVDMLVLYKE